MLTFPEQLERLARDLPALEYGRNAWIAIRAHFLGAVGKDEAEHVIECITRLRKENETLRSGLTLIANGGESADSLARLTLQEAKQP